MRSEQAALKHLRSPLYAGFTTDLNAHGCDALAFLPPENAFPPETPIVRDRALFPVRGGLRAPEGLFFGIERGGQVVSWAVAGRMKEGVRLVTVETDPPFRGRGLAVQALRALVRETGEPLLYLCAPGNAASARAALKAGFTLLGCVFFHKA